MPLLLSKLSIFEHFQSKKEGILLFPGPVEKNRLLFHQEYRK
jgi:hypothetical protein